ncbi:YqgE/AlgH family protein [Rhodovulum sp. YNF3179]|uniref:YqgE/AlgH family protein n=1 Tax=Rhodovulum sp. YNF3179 TaxID=3425127 RepID=UPI003D33690F
MTDTAVAESLSGKLLIAMPGMSDPRFEKSVVYLCAHSADGAMGLIVNKPTPDLRFSDLLEQLEIAPSDDTSAIRVHFGGPVEHGRGFVLHSSDYRSNESTLQVDEDFGMTATLDILEDIARGAGPGACLLALGYAGWGPGQLEQELQANGWLTCAAAPDLVFSADDAGKWTAALESMGISPSFLSADGGSA